MKTLARLTSSSTDVHEISPVIAETADNFVYVVEQMFDVTSSIMEKAHPLLVGTRLPA